jgi:hypothetical protein
MTEPGPPEGISPLSCTISSKLALWFSGILSLVTLGTRAITLSICVKFSEAAYLALHNIPAGISLGLSLEPFNYPVSDRLRYVERGTSQIVLAVDDAFFDGGICRWRVGTDANTDA